MIADRFLFTGLARDVARGLDLDWVLKLYQPLLWPDLVFYFSVSPVTSGKRVTATRMPNFYEAGQDVTDVDDPVESYQRFIARVIREYESLALIFNFITVDAEQSIGEQHRQIRELFREGERRPWSDWNVDAVAEWLRADGRTARRSASKAELIAVDGVDAAARARGRARARIGPAGGAGGVSRWDASGIFQDLAVADDAAGRAVGADAAAALRGRSRVPPALGDPAGARGGPHRRRGAVRRHRDRVRSRGRTARRLARRISSASRHRPPSGTSCTAKRTPPATGSWNSACQRVHGVDRRARRKLISGAAAHAPRRSEATSASHETIVRNYGSGPRAR